MALSTAYPTTRPVTPSCSATPPSATAAFSTLTASTTGFCCLISVASLSLPNGSGGTELLCPRCGATVRVSLPLHVNKGVRRTLGEEKRTKTIKIGVGGCSVALFVNINPNGGFCTDHGWWPSIARRGRYVADTCLMDLHVGGGAAYAGKGKKSRTIRCVTIVE